jgi:hypothetical protein
MPDTTLNKRYEVTISLTAREIKDGTPVPFFDNALSYHDLPYEGLVACEQVLLDALQKLGEAGIGQAMKLGLGDKLAAIGMGSKVAAFAAKIK